MGEILSAEDIANTRAAAMNVYHEAPDPFMRGMLRILDSHEALRARLAEVEQVLDVERDYWRVRSELAHTAAERVMAEWHLDLIDAALAAAVLDKGEPK